VYKKGFLGIDYTEDYLIKGREREREREREKHAI